MDVCPDRGRRGRRVRCTCPRRVAAVREREESVPAITENASRDADRRQVPPEVFSHLFGRYCHVFPKNAHEIGEGSDNRPDVGRRDDDLRCPSGRCRAVRRGWGRQERTVGTARRSIGQPGSPHAANHHSLHGCSDLACYGMSRRTGWFFQHTNGRSEWLRSLGTCFRSRKLFRVHQSEAANPQGAAWDSSQDRWMPPVS